MNTVSIDFAKNEFDSLVARVLEDAAPTTVSLPDGSAVVVMSMEEFTSWQETTYLLQSPENGAHLRKSINESQVGDIAEHKLIDP